MKYPVIDDLVLQAGTFDLTRRGREFGPYRSRYGPGSAG
jgi:hypothetical protein